MYDKLTFAKGLGASLGFLLIVIAIGVYTGVAFAVPISGVGGYTVAADHIEGESAFIYPQTNVDTSGAGDRTAAVVELKSTNIDGLKITKPISIPGGGSATVVITADDNVVSDEILLKVSSVEAANADLNLLEIDENSGPPSQQLELRAAAPDPEGARHVDISAGDGPDVVLEEPRLQTHYLVTNRIQLPGLSVEVQSG